MQPFDMLRGFLVLIFSALAIATISDFDARADANDDLRELARKQGRTEIVVLLDKAQAGNPEAQYALGHSLLAGHSGVRDTNLGIEWLEKAARNGSTGAAAYLGRLFEYGWSPYGVTVPKDVAKATYWYEKAYASGTRCVAINLANIAEDAKPADHDRAIQWIEKCAESGLRTCQERLAYRYLYGRVVRQDYAKSLRWLLEAVKPPDNSGSSQRLGTLQALIGMQFENGLGTSKNVAKAIEWYQRAAESGDKKLASYALGRLYEAGSDVPVDAARAVQFFSKAAQAGYGPAQYRLALAYQRGMGLQRDQTLALKWLILATHDSNRDSGEDENYYRSNPVLFGIDTWGLDRATRTVAERDLVQLKNEMGPEQVRVAEALAAKFEPELPMPPYCGPHGCPMCW